MERKYFAIGLMSRPWFEEVLSGQIDVWQFPPGRKPRLGHMESGDYVLLLTRKDRKFVGELRLKDAKLVSYEQFEKDFRERAYEVNESPFVLPGQSCWVVVFDQVIKYKREVNKDEVLDFPIRGFSPLTDKHWDKREKCRNLAGIGEIIKPGWKTNLHEDAKRKLEELGRIFGWFSKREYVDRGVPIDVVWKEREDFPKVHKGFEVQHKGNLLIALSHLQHLSDWGKDTDLFLVITDEKDKEKAKTLLEMEPHLSGTFHRIRGQTEIITYDGLVRLYEEIKRSETFIRRAIGHS